MSWRVLVRKEVDTDKWDCSKAFYDREEALNLFFVFDEGSDEWDVMLVKEERFSSAREFMGVKDEDVKKDE